MGIVQRIRERYAAEEVLPFAAQINSLSFAFAPSVPADVQNGIRCGAADLALREEEGEEADLSLQLEKAEDALVLTVNGKNTIRFPSRDSQLRAVIWTIYGLATSAEWTSLLYGKSVCAEVYNSDQQILAAALLKAALQWQSGRPNVEIDLKHAVEQGTVELIREGPRLSMQPVMAEAWEAFDYSLFPKKQMMSGQELMRSLYGSNNFVKQLEAYCGFIRSNEEYKKELCETAKKLLHKMHRQPIAGLRNALYSAAQELLDQYEKELAGKPRMDAQLTVSKLTPEIVGALFSQLDKIYERDMAARVRKCFLQDLLRCCESALHKQIQQAKTAIQALHCELRSFCVVAVFNELQPELPPDFPPDIPVLDFGWDQSVNVRDKTLQVPHTVWDESMLYRLQMTGSLGRSIWLAAPALAKLADVSYASVTFGVPHLSEQIVIGLRAE